jgi:hypothetical protein
MAKKTPDLDLYVDTSVGSTLILWSRSCNKSRDGILGHQFNKRLESFAYDIYSPFCWRILKKTILYSGFNNPYNKNPRNKKTRVYSWIAFCRTEKWGQKNRKNSEKTRVYAQKPRLKMPFKKSISGLVRNPKMKYFFFVFISPLPVEHVSSLVQIWSLYSRHIPPFFWLPR